MQIPKEHIKDHYRPVMNPIVDGFKHCLALNEPSFLLIKESRGNGKSYSISKIISTLMSQNENYNCLMMTKTRGNTRDVLEKSGYLREHGLTEENGWRWDGNEYLTCTKTGSMFLFATIADKSRVEQKRGIHNIRFIYQEEAQNITEYNQWMEVFGKMGKSHNSIKVIVGTGSKTPESLIQHIEALLKTRRVPGTIVSKTIYDCYNEDPCEYWAAQIKQEELEALVPMTVEGEVRNKFAFPQQNPGFMREIMCEHVMGEVSSELAFPDLLNEDIDQSEYQIDFDKPVIQFADYGSYDPYGCLFAQIQGNTVHIFDEIYNQKKVTRNMSTFAYDLALKLNDLKLATISTEDSTSQTGEQISYQKFNVKFLHNQIYFGGDDHGKSNWNHYLELYFGSSFVGPVDMAENGLALIRQFIETKQLVIHSKCARLISDLQSVVIVPYPNKFAISIDHKKSTLIVALSYILQALVNASMLPIVKPGDIPKVEKVEEKKESLGYVLPYTEYKKMTDRNYAVRKFLGRI